MIATSSTVRRSGLLSRALLYTTAAALGLLAAYALVASPPLVKVLLLFPAVVGVAMVPPDKVFLGWLICAPFVQGASSGNNSGHVFFKFLFFVPPLVLVARMAVGGLRRNVKIRPIDLVPAAYLGYILVRVGLVPSALSGDEASLRGIYGVVGVGVIAYYFTAFADTPESFSENVTRALIWSGIGVALLAIVDAATAWNLWHNTIGGNGELRRVSSTFDGPVPLGTFLGAAIAFAVSALVWKGPRSLRLPSFLLIGLSIPALYFTYTRGPILAAAAVSVAMLLLANRARWPSLLAFAAVALLLALVWKDISTTNIYEKRFSITSTITSRAEIQHESIELFRKKPVFGWGYNTFDQVRLTLPDRDPRISKETSHDTYLTVIVELGIVGLVLLLLPTVVIAWRAIGAGWRLPAERWILGGCVGTVACYAIGALTYDARFFSLTTALPWIALGLARSRVSGYERSQAAASHLSALRAQEG
jgi:hypothetical protein